MNAHFYDLNSLITINSKVWIVDKLNPNKPLLKITKSEFNLIRKGVYKKDNINFEISDTKYWISEELYNRLKINSKKNKVDVSSLSFSMREFMDSEIIDNDDYTIHLENIRHLKNSQADIYIICSKNSRRSYDFIIDKLKDKIADFGLTIKDFYFISETFYNRDKVEIIHKKIKIALQHLVGLKTSDNKFTSEEITKYDNLFLYDDDLNTIKLAKNVNEVLKVIINNSDDDVKEVVKNILK